MQRKHWQNKKNKVLQIVPDFNISLSIKDRTSIQKINKENELNTIYHLNILVTIIYRTFHPTAEHTFFSFTWRTFNSIDHVSQNKCTKFLKVKPYKVSSLTTMETSQKSLTEGKL